MTAPIDAEFVAEPGTAVAVRPPEGAAIAPSGLFGVDDPVDVLARATRVADALKGVVVQKKLVSNIQGKEYPQVEAWTTLAAMLGIAVVTEWSRRVEGGWEARVVAQRNGQTIGAAEAQCTRDERTWKSRDDYALRSMAQTRATSKALRLPLGFIMVLAGYNATPAEEMPAAPEPEKRERQARDPLPKEEARPALDRDVYRKRLFAKLNDLARLNPKYEGLKDDERRHAALEQLYAKHSLNDLNDEQALDFERRVDSYITKEREAESVSSQDHSV